jgi:hypothetical protein
MAIAVLLMATGCEYHPYYDGQKLRIYNRDHGVIETDGTHLYVPIVGRHAFEIEIYGGAGKHHKVTLADQEYFSYTYKEADVDNGFLGEGVYPATLTLEPLQLGDTSMTIADEDTGESIQLYVHIIEAFNMMEIFDSHGSLAAGNVLAFDYVSGSDLVKIARKDQETGAMELIVEGRFRFLDYDSTVALELSYPADSEGQPDASGAETVKRFLVEFQEGGVHGSAQGMLHLMNLNDVMLHTRLYMPDYEFEYNEKFRFVDITDNENPDMESPDTRIFYAFSAKIQPWAE